MYISKGLVAMKTLNILCAVVIVCFLAPSGAHSARVYDTFQVLGFLQTGKKDTEGNTNYGGCMVRVSPSPNTLWAECDNTYLSLGCDSQFISKSAGTSNLAAAQLAYVSNKTLLITVETTQKHNGFCLGDTVQIVP